MIRDRAYRINSTRPEKQVQSSLMIGFQEVSLNISIAGELNPQNNYICSMCNEWIYYMLVN
jgi:hypothetical protein